MEENKVVDIVQVGPDGFPMVRYDVTEATITQLKADYMSLTIKGVEDREGYNRVDAARKKVKGLRCDVENRRKELKAPATEYGKRIDSTAKAIIEKLQPIEDYLQEQQNTINQEKMKLAQEEERKIKDRAIARQKEMFGYGYLMSEEDARRLSEEDYQREVSVRKAAHEQAHKQAEKQRRKEREEQERKERDLKEQQEKLRLEREEFERQKQASQPPAQDPTPAQEPPAEMNYEVTEQTLGQVIPPPEEVPAVVTPPPDGEKPCVEIVFTNKIRPHIFVVMTDKGELISAHERQEQADGNLDACRRGYPPGNNFEVVEYVPISDMLPF